MATFRKEYYAPPDAYSTQKRAYSKAVVTEGGSFCYGSTETGFFLLTKQTTGRWTKIFQSQGIAEFLPTRGVGRMPDISIGGPGFCFPVIRWNGKTYAQNRWQYDGKPCRPPR